MCLAVDVKKSTKIKKNIKYGKKFCRKPFYKVLLKDKDNILTSPLRHKIWSIGINESNRDTTYCSKRYDDIGSDFLIEIKNGIHVFYNLNDARLYAAIHTDSFTDVVIVKVKVDLANFVAVGATDSREKLFLLK